MDITTPHTLEYDGTEKSNLEIKSTDTISNNEETAGLDISRKDYKNKARIEHSEISDGTSILPEKPPDHAHPPIIDSDKEKEENDLYKSDDFTSDDSENKKEKYPRENQTTKNMDITTPHTLENDGTEKSNLEIKSTDTISNNEETAGFDISRKNYKNKARIEHSEISDGTSILPEKAPDHAHPPIIDSDKEKEENDLYKSDDFTSEEERAVITRVTENRKRSPNFNHYFELSEPFSMLSMKGTKSLVDYPSYKNIIHHAMSYSPAKLNDKDLAHVAKPGITSLLPKHKSYSGNKNNLDGGSSKLGTAQETKTPKPYTVNLKDTKTNYQLNNNFTHDTALNHSLIVDVKKEANKVPNNEQNKPVIIDEKTFTTRHNHTLTNNSSITIIGQEDEIIAKNKTSNIGTIAEPNVSNIKGNTTEDIVSTENGNRTPVTQKGKDLKFDGDVVYKVKNNVKRDHGSLKNDYESVISKILNENKEQEIMNYQTNEKDFEKDPEILEPIKEDDVNDLIDTNPMANNFRIDTSEDDSLEPTTMRINDRYNLKKINHLENNIPTINDVSTPSSDIWNTNMEEEQTDVDSQYSKEEEFVETVPKKNDVYRTKIVIDNNEDEKDFETNLDEDIYYMKGINGMKNKVDKGSKLFSSTLKVQRKPNNNYQDQEELESEGEDYLEEDESAIAEKLNSIKNRNSKSKSNKLKTDEKGDNVEDEQDEESENSENEEGSTFFKTLLKFKNVNISNNMDNNTVYSEKPNNTEGNNRNNSQNIDVVDNSSTNSGSISSDSKDRGVVSSSDSQAKANIDFNKDNNIRNEMVENYQNTSGGEKLNMIDGKKPDQDTNQKTHYPTQEKVQQKRNIRNINNENYNLGTGTNSKYYKLNQNKEYVQLFPYIYNSTHNQLLDFNSNQQNEHLLIPKLETVNNNQETIAPQMNQEIIVPQMTINSPKNIEKEESIQTEKHTIDPIFAQVKSVQDEININTNKDVLRINMNDKINDSNSLDKTIETSLNENHKESNTSENVHKIADKKIPTYSESDILNMIPKNEYEKIIFDELTNKIADKKIPTYSESDILNMIPKNEYEKIIFDELTIKIADKIPTYSESDILNMIPKNEYEKIIFDELTKSKRKKMNETNKKGKLDQIVPKKIKNEVDLIEYIELKKSEMNKEMKNKSEDYDIEKKSDTIAINNNNDYIKKYQNILNEFMKHGNNIAPSSVGVNNLNNQIELIFDDPIDRDIIKDIQTKDESEKRAIFDDDFQKALIHNSPIVTVHPSDTSDEDIIDTIIINPVNEFLTKINENIRHILNATSKNKTNPQKEIAQHGLSLLTSINDNLIPHDDVRTSNFQEEIESEDKKYEETGNDHSIANSDSAQKGSVILNKADTMKDDFQKTSLENHIDQGQTNISTNNQTEDSSEKSVRDELYQTTTNKTDSDLNVLTKEKTVKKKNRKKIKQDKLPDRNPEENLSYVEKTQVQKAQGIVVNVFENVLQNLGRVFSLRRKDSGSKGPSIFTVSTTEKVPTENGKDESGTTVYKHGYHTDTPLLYNFFSNQQAKENTVPLVYPSTIPKEQINNDVDISKSYTNAYDYSKQELIRNNPHMDHITHNKIEDNVDKSKAKFMPKKGELNAMENKLNNKQKEIVTKGMKPSSKEHNTKQVDVISEMKKAIFPNGINKETAKKPKTLKDKLRERSKLLREKFKKPKSKKEIDESDINNSSADSEEMKNGKKSEEVFDRKVPNFSLNKKEKQPKVTLPIEKNNKKEIDNYEYLKKEEEIIKEKGKQNSLMDEIPIELLKLDHDLELEEIKRNNRGLLSSVVTKPETEKAIQVADKILGGVQNFMQKIDPLAGQDVSSVMKEPKKKHKLNPKVNPMKRKLKVKQSQWKKNLLKPTKKTPIRRAPTKSNALNLQKNIPALLFPKSKRNIYGYKDRFDKKHTIVKRDISNENTIDRNKIPKDRAINIRQDENEHLLNVIYNESDGQKENKRFSRHIALDLLHFDPLGDDPTISDTIIDDFGSPNNEQLTIPDQSQRISDYKMPDYMLNGNAYHFEENIQNYDNLWKQEQFRWWEFKIRYSPGN
ncbi:uncharacterized protein PF11_0213-like [Diaphorina citri]|uniref:Uncharacterized protein PF11_0213-like n=1 Tax=Diaphorina citri TaxID=121845 RepID=A0A3Q0IT24_DIACI|nr:uncharacterized protein PF11_0213-like [Diaphorina citri]